MYLQSLALSGCVPKIDDDSRVIRTQIARDRKSWLAKYLRMRTIHRDMGKDRRYWEGRMRPSNASAIVQVNATLSPEGDSFPCERV
jgi:hypothetical protein